MKLKNFSKKELVLAVNNSNSISQTLRFLGMGVSGTNYPEIKKYIKIMNIDISHFSGGRISCNKKPIDDYLSNKNYLPSTQLKKRLLNEGFFEKQCEICKNTKWMGLPIPLELHHKDSNNHNNNLSNLQILCANCHSQIPTKVQKMETFKGKTQCRSDWAKDYGINPIVLANRLNKGLSMEDALKNIHQNLGT